MIATAILVVALLGLFTAVADCIVFNDSNGNLVKAINCAECALERIKGEAYANITSTYTLPACTINNQAVVPTLAVYNNNAGLKEITVNVNWNERQRSRNFRLSTRVAR